MEKQEDRGFPGKGDRGLNRHSPIKVFHITNTLRIGGAENALCLLVKNLDPKRFSPTVICIRAGGPLEEDLTQAGIPVKILHRNLRSVLLFPLFLWDVLVIFWDLYHLFKREHPGIIQTHLPASDYLTIMAGIWVGILPIIYTFHSSTFLPIRRRKSLRTWLRIKLTQFLCRRVQIIVAVSKAIQDKLLEVVPGQADSIRVIANGIDVAAFRSRQPEMRIKQKIGMNQEDILITTVGSLSSVKNQAMLLKAASKLIIAYPKVRFIIVGEGPLKEELLLLKENLGLNNYCLFLGLRKDIPEILSDTDIFVSTSRWEGLPLAILEAMAASVPIVATAVPGIKEVLVDGSGILVPLNNVEELKKALDRLIKDHQLRQTIGKKGQERVSHFYSLSTFIHRWQDLYEELILKAEARRGGSEQ